jgi:hypothetical protein
MASRATEFRFGASAESASPAFSTWNGYCGLVTAIFELEPFR